MDYCNDMKALELKSIERWSLLPISQWEGRVQDGQLVYLRYDEQLNISMGVGATWSKAIDNTRKIGHWTKWNYPNLIPDSELVWWLKKEGIVL